jgi:hypothetical protein
VHNRERPQKRCYFFSFDLSVLRLSSVCPLQLNPTQFNLAQLHSAELSSTQFSPTQHVSCLRSSGLGRSFPFTRLMLIAGQASSAFPSPSSMHWTTRQFWAAGFRLIHASYGKRMSCSLCFGVPISSPLNSAKFS